MHPVCMMKASMTATNRGTAVIHTAIEHAIVIHTEAVCLTSMYDGSIRHRTHRWQSSFTMISTLPNPYFEKLISMPSCCEINQTDYFKV